MQSLRRTAELSYNGGMKIVSASRRTDIPAFYTPWLMNRLRAGFVRVPNPFNPRSISRIPLHPRAVGALVLLTKDPRPMIPHLDELECRGYRFCFQVSMTGLPAVFEPGVPGTDAVAAAVREISRRIGRKRMAWRFDPILFSSATPPEGFPQLFRRLARGLEGATSEVIISFAKPYTSVAARVRTSPASSAGMRFHDPEDAGARMRVAEALAEEAAACGMSIRSCSEDAGLAASGIPAGACIDAAALSEVFGVPLEQRKGVGQRKSCPCSRSFDIGIYGTCPHRCVYCYASCDRLLKTMRHDPDADILIGESEQDAEGLPGLTGF